MILRRGDLMKHLSEPDYVVITANSYINKRGELVMGRGFAKQMAKKFPELPADFGDSLQDMAKGEYYLFFPYGFGMGVPRALPENVGVLQVKRHFRENADIELIRKSLERLDRKATRESDKIFYLNFPGVGYGRLRREDVLPLLQDLPNNVHIWEYEDE